MHVFSERDDASGDVRGELFKTAQSLSTFQRHQFFRRFYDLNLARKELKIFEKPGGTLKDTVLLKIASVVTCLSPDLREDYQQFFIDSDYEDIKINPPKLFKFPFALVMEDGSMHLLWASSQIDFKNWTEAFQQLTTPTENNQDRNEMAELPMPEVQTSNYFIVNVYFCLIPPDQFPVNDQLMMTARSSVSNTAAAMQAEAIAKHTGVKDPLKLATEVVVEKNLVEGWLQKTAQELKMFQREKFPTRHYSLNMTNASLTVGESPTDNFKTTIEFRRTKLIKVELKLNRASKQYTRFFPKGKACIDLPKERSEPIGLLLDDGMIHILWTKPGKDFKVWSRALQKMCVGLPTGQVNYMAEKSENMFISNLYWGLLPVPELDFKSVHKNSDHGTVEGWLCKTSKSRPSNQMTKPFLKAYTVLDLKKQVLLLCDKTNGEVAEKIVLKDRLVNFHSDIIGQIDHERLKKSQFSPALLDNLGLPLTFIYPFAIFLDNGEMDLFWASTKADYHMWTNVLKQLLPQDIQAVDKYLQVSRENQFLVALFECLVRGSATEDRKAVEVVKKKSEIIQGQIHECVQTTSEGGELFVLKHYRLDTKTNRLSIYDARALEMEEEVFLSGRVSCVVTELTETLDQVDQRTRALQDCYQEVKLPETGAKPIAVCLIGGSLFLFWPASEAERVIWIEAFQKISSESSIFKESVTTLDLTEESDFCVSLFKCLVPLTLPFQDAITSVTSLEGFMHMISPNVGSEIFPLVYSKLQLEQDCLQVFSNLEKGDILAQHKLSGNVRCFDTFLLNELTEAFQQLLGSPDEYPQLKGMKEIQLPRDKHPLAIIFITGKVLLFWLSENEIEKWTARLAQIAPKRSECEHQVVIVRSPANYLCATVYQHLKRKPTIEVPKSDLVDEPMIQPEEEKEDEPLREALEESIEEPVQEEVVEEEVVTPTKDVDQEEAKSTEEETEEQVKVPDQVKQSDQQDEISGWLLRTLGKNPTSNSDEPWLQMFFRFNIPLGVLTEFQDERGRKLDEHILWRKVAWVETNLQNKLRQDHEKTFRKIIGAKPDFKMPSQTMKPFALHLIDGNVIVFWASLNSYQAWTNAFKSLLVEPTEGQQEILIKTKNENVFTVSIFLSLVPQTPHRQNESEPPEDKITIGYCLKTVKELKVLQTEYVYKRFIKIDGEAKIMRLHKEQTMTSAAKEETDLSTLVWVDTTLSDKFKQGYEHYFADCGFSNTSFNERFAPAKGFHNPLVLGFELGDITVIWFDSEIRCQEIADALRSVIATNKNRSGSTGHKYVIMPQQNAFSSALYLALEPKTPIGGDQYQQPGLLTGCLARATGSDQENFFTNQYVTLDSMSGTLRVFKGPYSKCLETFDMRFCRTLDLKDQQTVVLESTQTISWDRTEKPIIVHTGSSILIFIVEGKQNYQQWNSAFRQLQTASYQSIDLWIDKSKVQPAHLNFMFQTLGETNIVKMSRTESAAKLNNSSMERVSEKQIQLNGFLCKTSQVQKMMKGKIFYKRYYTLNRTSKELIIRLKPGQDIKEKIDLKRCIACIKTDLSRQLCRDYRQIMASQVKSKIMLPKEFAFPFSIVFVDGSVMLLWASTQEQMVEWSSNLTELIEGARIHPVVHLQSESNLFVATMLQCLTKQKPAILLEKKFLPLKKLRDIESDRIFDKIGDFDSAQKPGREDGQLEENGMNFGLTSSRAILEGWAYKTSQSKGMFQSNIYHLRYYRLNLMLEELKIFDKPSGTLKHQIDLSSKLVRVDDELANKLTPELIQKYGEMPQYKYPLAVFAMEQSMLLWFQTDREQRDWRDGFTQIMQSSDKEQIAKFEVPKDTKKIVVAIYNVLKSQYYSGVAKPADLQKVRRRTQSNVPMLRSKPSTKQGQLPTTLQDTEDDSKIDLTNMANLSNKKPKKQTTDDDRMIEPKPKTSEEIIQEKLMKHLPPRPVQKVQLPDKDDQAQDDSASKENDEVAASPFNQVNRILNKANRHNRNTDMIKFGTDHSNIEQMNTNMANLAADPIDSARQSASSLLPDSTADAEAIDGPRRGRRYRALSGTQNAPIKVKKIIPIKNSLQQTIENINSNRDSLQQIHRLSLPNQSQNILSRQVPDGMGVDDDISDIAAQVIKPGFRRTSTALSAGGKKIKVRIRGTSAGKTKDNRFKTNSGTFSFTPGQNKVNFDEKCQEERDGNFIDNLIEKQQFSHRQRPNSSAWSGVANELRKKIIMTTQSQQQDQDSSIASPVPQVNDKMPKFSRGGPIKVLDIQMSHPIAPTQDNDYEQPSLLHTQKKPLSKPMAFEELSGQKQISQTQTKLKKQTSGELSDWDESSESDNDIERASAIIPRKRGNSIVNVRDRTVGLSNVYSGQAPARSSFVFSSIKPQEVDMQAEQIEEDETPVEENAYQNPYASNQQSAPNENDCIAESINSVWD